MRGKILSLLPLVITLIVYIDLIYVNTPIYKHALKEAKVRGVEYTPQAYLKFGGDAKLKEFLPHRFTFDVETAGDNLLVLNHFYWPGWKVTEGKLIEYNRQMAAVLGRKNGDVTFYYSPKSFKAGITLSLFTSLLCIFLLWRSRRRSGLKTEKKVEVRVD